jgi:hypothetical protein
MKPQPTISRRGNGAHLTICDLASALKEGSITR